MTDNLTLPNLLVAQATQYVLAVLDYDAVEETLLGFRSGAVIKLLPRDGAEDGECGDRGCEGEIGLTLRD